MATDPDKSALWLSFARRTKGGHCVTDYTRLATALEAGPVPAGVALYATRQRAKEAVWWALNRPTRPPPDHLVPAATT